MPTGFSAEPGYSSRSSRAGSGLIRANLQTALARSSALPSRRSPREWARRRCHPQPSLCQVPAQTHRSRASRLVPRPGPSIGRRRRHHRRRLGQQLLLHIVRRRSHRHRQLEPAWLIAMALVAARRRAAVIQAAALAQLAAPRSLRRHRPAWHLRIGRPQRPFTASRPSRPICLQLGERHLRHRKPRTSSNQPQPPSSSRPSLRPVHHAQRHGCRPSVARRRLNYRRHLRQTSPSSRRGRRPPPPSPPRCLNSRRVPTPWLPRRQGTQPQRQLHRLPLAVVRLRPSAVAVSTRRA